MRTFILPYKTGRRVPRELSRLLGWKQIKTDNSKYVPKNGDVVVNWGRSSIWKYENKVKMVNNPEIVADAVDKICCLEILSASGISIVESTTDKRDAEDWIHNGSVVYCRTVLNGHSGQGIVIANTKEELVPAPLYTKGIGKCREYRIHVIGGEAVLIAQKKRRNGGDADGAIKNHGSGWVYSTNDIKPISDVVIQTAVQSVEALGLDFGAVDIATRNDNYFVFEVNTAPGLHGKTLEVYAERLDKLVKTTREESF